jgi:lysophospholipase L1-like esterase
VRWYEAEVQGLDRGRRDRFNANRAPAFYGSSSIRLWDTLAEGFDRRVLNLGFGGATLEACDHFFARLVPPVSPRSLLLYAGDNDFGDRRAVEEVLGWFRSLADKVAGLPRQYPVRLRVRQAQPGTLSYLSTASVDSTSASGGRYFLEDGLHLNRDGYRLWGHLLDPHRNQIFTK